MPLSILVVLAIVALIGLSIAAITTVRAESRQGTGRAASLMYRAYGA